MGSEAPRRLARRALTLGLLVAILLPPTVRSQEAPTGYQALAALFAQWQAFEPPPLR
jgi:hypothetical protein